MLRGVRKAGAGGAGAGHPGRRGALPPLQRGAAGAGHAPDPRRAGGAAVCPVRGRKAPVQLPHRPGGPAKTSRGVGGVPPRHAGAGIPDAGFL